MLDAGIDVFSTVNVQHLESLNDQVAELTGTRVRETVPDAVLASADEVVLDRHHAAVADRAAAGRQDLSHDRVQARSTTSSRSRTSARCERSRCARSPRRSRPSAPVEPAARREERLSTARPPGDRRAPARAGHPAPKSQRVVRRAWRSAQRLGARARRAVGDRPRADERAARAARRPAAADQRARRPRSRSSTATTSRPRDARVAQDRGTRIPIGHAHGERPRRRILQPALPCGLHEASPARGRRPHRRRSNTPPEKETAMTALLIVIVRSCSWPGGAGCVPGRPGSSPCSRDSAQVRAPGPDCRRVLFPFVGGSCSRRGPWTQRCGWARAEDRLTLLPVFLARVVADDAALWTPRSRAVRLVDRHPASRRRSSTRQAESGGPGRRASWSVAALYRHAPAPDDRQNERFDRIVIAAAPENGPGFGPDDVAWLLGHAPGEIVVLRPGAEDQLVPVAPRSRRRRAVSQRRGDAGARRRRDAVAS